MVRAVTGGAASNRGLGYDRVEEARLAVNEAAAILIQGGSSSILTCEVSGTQGLDITLVASPGPEPWPPRGWAESLEHAVLESVTDEFEVTPQPGVRLSFATGA